MKIERNWKTVKFEELGANVGTADFEGLIGFEECHDYDTLSSRKDKRKRKAKTSTKTASAKKPKVKPSDDFKVETLSPDASLTPSRANINVAKKSKAKKVKKDDSNKNENKVKGTTDTVKSKKKASKKSKKKKPKKKPSSNGKIIDVLETTNAGIPMEDMQAWSSFGIPEPIMKALSEQGFEKPTMIQELTLPAAMHGRRDILGAAETGSGKTLAFGIPIISGILQIKENMLNGNVSNRRGVKRDMYALEESEEKIVNMNRLSKEEINKLRKPQRKTKWKMKRTAKNPEDEEDNSEESDDDEDDVSDKAEDEDNIFNESEAEDDISNESEVEDDISNESEVEDDISDKSENEDDVSSSATEDALSNDDMSLGHLNESDIDEISIDKPKPKTAANDYDSSESDSEEREEEGDAANTDEIGCVKVIDNIPLIKSDETVKPASGLKPLYALILTPTRELAIQVKNHLVAAAKHSDVRIAVVVGGMAQVKQERILAKGPEIVVATPGRLWEMIQQGNNHLSQINDITYLAIDETDRMIERGHFEELHHILDQINDNEEKKLQRQNFVFSATLTMVHDLPAHLKSRKVTKKGKLIKKKYEKLTPEQKLKKVIELLGITDPKIVDVTKDNRGSSNTLTECRISCPIDYKDYYLYYVLRRHPGRSIVFCNSIGCVKRLGQLFGLLQCKPLPLHSNMQQRQRLKNLDRFRADPMGLLIATDVAARGLDIPNVEHVIHYQVPRTAENYVHRSGRTARASKEGITILIMEPGEVQNYVKLCRTLSKVEDLPHFPVPDALLSATKQRVNLAREVDQLELKMRKTNTEVGWYEKSMREMDIVLDEREMPQRMDKDVAAELKTALTIKKKQLTGLLAAHLFPKGFSFKYPSSNSAMEDELVFGKKQNALEAMKSAMESGLIKQLKKSTKNQAHLSLANKDSNLHKVNENSGKISKNKLKKMKRKNTST